MPRETIRKLSEDAERVLVAGAHLAVGDAGLLRAHAALQKLVTQLGTKAPPVLGKLADAAERASAAGPNDQARELLTLATSVAQVRAAQVQLAVVTDDVPLQAVTALGTPCNSKDLYSVHDALVSKGTGRMEIIDAALERGDIADLRLVHAVVHALGDSHAELATRIGERVVPAFGRAILEPVRASLQLPGRSVDGRRLRALVAVEKADSLPLVERALREGSAEVREAALEALADHLPGEPTFEARLLDLLGTERASGVRTAALRALRGYGSDAAVQALWQELDKSLEPKRLTDARAHRAIAEGLGGSTHPQTIERLLARLTTATENARAPVKRGDEVGTTKRAAAEVEIRIMFAALAEMDDGRIVPVVRELLGDWPELAAQAMLRSAGPADLVVLADLLNGDRASTYWVAVAAARRLSPAETLERLGAPLLAADRADPLGEARQRAIVGSGFLPTGEGWTATLLAAVRQKPFSPHAVRLLAACRVAEAVPVLVELLDVAAEPEAQILAHALGALGELAAFEPLLRRLLASGRSIWGYHAALLGTAHEATVDRIRTLHAEASAEHEQRLAYLLRALERKFPGA